MQQHICPHTPNQPNKSKSARGSLGLKLFFHLPRQALSLSLCQSVLDLKNRIQWRWMMGRGVLNVPAGVSHGCEGRACSKPAAGDIPKLSIHLYTKQRKEIAPRIVAFERAKSLRRKERRNGRFCFTTTRSGQQQSERNAQQESHRHLIACLDCRLHATAHGEYCARLCNVDHRNDGVLLPPLSACNGTAAQPCMSTVLPALRCLFCDGHCMCCVVVWCCGMVWCCVAPVCHVRFRSR